MTDRLHEHFNAEITDSELRGKVFVTEIDPADEESLRKYFQFRYDNYKDTGELSPESSPEAMYQDYKKTLAGSLPLDTPDIQDDEQETRYHQSLIHEIKDYQGNILAGGQMDIYTKRNRKEAVLYGNAVDEGYRSKNLSPLLIEVGLERAAKAGCVQASGEVRRTNPAALRSALKAGFKVMYDHSRPEGMQRFYSVGNYYITQMLGPDADAQSEENVNYETQSIPLAEEGRIIDALTDGWEGYEVEKFDPASPDAQPSLLLRKAVGREVKS